MPAPLCNQGRAARLRPRTAPSAARPPIPSSAVAGSGTGAGGTSRIDIEATENAPGSEVKSINPSSSRPSGVSSPAKADRVEARCTVPPSTAPSVPT
ncbi:hypothetical protein TQ29_16660 [Actibacterium sp. EMB200-NS6]|nr:hypothetical protein TQ29_16660 [Actibacterium sp. EMB200-NS6]